MAERNVLVCDVCEAEPALRTTIIIEDEAGNQTAWTADLCHEHRTQAPISAIVIHARESRIPSRTRGAYEKVTLEHMMEVAKRAREEGR